MPGFPILHHLPELAQTYSTELVMPSNDLALCCPLFLLPPIFPSIGIFSNKSGLRFRWPKYWSFSFSISPSNEYSGLISFGIDWFDLLAVQGALKSLLQHRSLKAYYEAIVINDHGAVIYADQMKRQIYRSMEQNWYPRKKPLHVQSDSLQQGCQHCTMRKDSVLNKPCWEKWISTCNRRKESPYLHHTQKWTQNGWKI